MMKFDHLSIAVTDCGRSRDWYVATLGLTRLIRRGAWREANRHADRTRA